MEDGGERKEQLGPERVELGFERLLRRCRSDNALFAVLEALHFRVDEIESVPSTTTSTAQNAKSLGLTGGALMEYLQSGYPQEEAP